MEFHLMRPEWLWSLVPALLLAIFLWRHRDRLGSWNQVISAELLPFLVSPQGVSRGPNLLPLVVLGWVLAGLAASGPSWQKLPLPVHQKQDALVLVLDLSYSMKSGDLAPSRLDRARQKLLDLLALRKEGQTGLIAYAGDAHIVTPLTDDTPTIANLLPALNPDMMPLPGSDPAAAVAQAVDLLHSAGIRNGKILLLTDGISASDGEAINRAMASSGASLAIMGIGTATGAPIPMPRGGFLKDRDGTIVMPTLDEGPLRTLASQSGGRYLPMQIDNSDLDILLAESPLTEREPTLALDRTADSWEDQGYLLLLPLLPLVLALFRRGWILCLLPLLFIAQPQPVRADGWSDLWLTPDQQGQKSLQQGNSEDAAGLFEDPAWAGTASYMAEDYETASDNFARIDDADNWYNRGNALARAGKLDEAIQAYQESLDRAPDREDAQANLELLEQLKQQQEQEQQQDNQQQDNKDQEQQENQDQQQNQEQNGQNQEQQQDQEQSEQQQQEQEQQQNQEGGNAQQDENQPQENSQDQQQPDQAAEEQNPQDQTGEQEQQAEEQEPTPGEQQAEIDPEAQERDQAMEQWLRRVPDDPSGLLREKFRYESYQRQQQGAPRKTMKRIGRPAGVLCLMLLVFAASTSWGAITASLDRDRAALGDTLRLTIIATDDEDLDELDLQPLTDDFEILQQSNSSKKSYINGTFTSTRELALDITPRRQGELAIPPLRVGQKVTNGLPVVIGPPPTNSAPDQNLVFEAELDRSSVYVQGQLILTLRLQQAINLEDRNITQLQLDNAFVRPLEQNSFQRTVNGRPWLVHEIRYAIFPEQSGTLTIPAQTFSARERAPRRSLFDLGSGGRQVRRTSDPLTIDVLPRPGSFPASEWLPASELTLEESWSTPPGQLKVGESATRTITIRGEGLQGAQLPPVLFPATPGLKYYPDQPVISDSESPTGLRGQRVDSAAVVPTRAGNWEIPELRVPWWDTRSNELRYAVLPGRKLQVVAGDLSTTATAPQALPAPTQALTPDAAVNIPIVGSDRDYFWKIIAAVNGAGWLLTLIYLLRKQRRRGKTAVPESGNADEKAAFRELVGACKKGDPRLARQSVLRWSAALTSNPGMASLSQVASALGDPAMSTTLETLNAALYSPGPASWDGTALAKAAEELRAQNRRRAKAGPPPLQLYPQPS